MESSYHDPVLCDEALGYLITDETTVYVDGTVGGGGHAERICTQLRGQGRLICFDADEDAIRYSRKRLERFRDRVSFVHSNFRTIKTELGQLGIDSIAGLLLDLGVSSFQLDEGTKGFSFRSDERLDMRLDRRQHMSAWHVVNTYDERALADVIWRFGEERYSRRIAKRIVAARSIDTTGALSAVVESTVGRKFLTKTLARVFQALRIEVNAELNNLEQVLADTLDLLVSGGRCVVISYHSLEDRIVKEFFRKESTNIIRSGEKYIADTMKPQRLKTLTKRPVKATSVEVSRNPRARSAKLRAAERLPG